MSDSPASMPRAVARVADDLRKLGGQGQPLLRSQTPPPDDLNGYATTELFVAEGRSILVVVLGQHRADPMNLSGVLGVMEVSEVPPSIAAIWTTQDPHHLAPIGHPHAMNVVIDIELASHPRIWLPAGHRDWVFPTTYAELLRITAGTAAEVGELP